MARPKIKTDRQRKNIALTLPPDLIERAKLYCDVFGLSVSAIVEELLTKHLNAIDRQVKIKVDAFFNQTTKETK